MKTTAIRSELADAVRAAASLCKDNSLPQLQFLRISGGKGKLLISATDLSDTLHIEVEAEGKKAGSTLVNAARLRDYLAADKAEQVALELKDDQLFIRGRIEVRLACLRADVAENYPTLPEFPAEPTATFEREALFATLRDGMKFITREVKAQRQQPGSVLLKEEGGLLWAGAVDRGFIAFVRQSICEAPQGFEIAISATTWGLLQAAKGSETIEIACAESGGNDCFRCGNLTVIGRRDETPHPNYLPFLKRLDGKSTLKLSSGQADAMLDVMRSMVALDGLLRIERNGDGVIRITRHSDTSQGAWEMQGIEGDQDPLKYVTKMPELWLPALEIMVREGTDIALQHTDGSVRLDGGSETYIMIAGCIDER